MPWKVINQMDVKTGLIKDWNAGHFRKTDLSHKYGVSRPTVYKWLQRYERYGIEGLKEQNRAPNRCPNRTSRKIIDLVIQEKLKNRKRGPRKVRAQIKRKYPEIDLPAVSTVGYWLKKEGLVEQRKKRLHVPPYTEPFSECKKPNDVWSIDYKGQFHIQNGRICYPLTVSDNYSRFLLGCKALGGPRHDPTRFFMESIFREYGLPDAIRSDNGTPFAGRCIGGLSRLMVWWILLGIIPERIRKGHPQENGRHERMHRTLKSDALNPVAGNLREQQKTFDRYRYDYNNNRPHESLNDETLSDYYRKSNRPYVESPHPPEYDNNYLVRKVRHSGDIKFMGRMFYITPILAGQPVGLREIGDGIWQLKFSFYALSSLDLRKNMVIRN
jgi:transposase InsO family protein